MDFNSIHRYPLVRILLPLLGGIIFADSYNNPLASISLLIAAELSLLLILFLLHRKNQSFRFRWLFGLVLFLFVFLLGAMRTWVSVCKPLNSTQSTSYLGVVESKPQLKSGYQHYTVGLRDSLNSRILLYLPYDSLEQQTLGYGAVIAFQGRINAPQKSLLELDFDYGNYLKHHTISGVCFVDSGGLTPIAEPSKSVEGYLMSRRQNIYNRYQVLGLEGDQLALVSALTLGVKDELSLELREAYSGAGVSHVLALSGLHIGLLFLIFTFCLNPLVQVFGLKKHWALLTSILLLWLFALFVGGSPSVVRSVFLYSLMGMAIFCRRQGNGINSLAGVALVMLLIHPFWLFDLGFILSFSAVLSILLFYPLFNRWIKPRTLLGRYFWGLIVVSLAAQLGTLPWILYYFESLPLYFLVANLLVIPMITLLLYLLVIYLVTLWIPFLSTLLTVLVGYLTATINEVVIWISGLPYASVDNIYIYPSVLVLLFLMLLAFYGLLKMHRATYLMAFLSSILLLIAGYWVEIYRHSPEKSFRLISTGSTYFLECVEEGGDLQLIIPEVWTVKTDKILSRYHRRWLRSQYTPPKVINKPILSDALIYQNGILFYGNLTVLLASESTNLSKSIAEENPYLIDYLILDKKSFNKLGIILDNYKFSTILATFKPLEWQLKYLREICIANKVEYLQLEGEAYIEFLP